MDMKQRNIFIITALLTVSYCITVQSKLQGTDRETSNTQSSSQTLQNKDSVFKAHLVNDEYQVWMDIDFYHNNITVPRQEIFGEVPGYFGAVRDTRKWIISDAAIKGKKALLTIINDYGSEDLTAELKRNSDGTYTLTRLAGSTMKIVVNNKWVKIPKDITFYVK